MANEPNSRARARKSVEARRDLVASGMKSSLSYRSIADLLGRQGFPNSLATIVKDVRVLNDRWREHSAGSVQEARALDLQRVDDVIRSLQTQVLQGSLGAIDRYLKAIALRAEMLGYNPPKRMAVGGWEGAPPIMVGPDAATAPSGIDLTVLSMDELGRLEELMEKASVATVP